VHRHFFTRFGAALGLETGGSALPVSDGDAVAIASVYV
jgi:hypothetical protein